MSFKLAQYQRFILGEYIFPGVYVSTIYGISKVIKCTVDTITVIPIGLYDHMQITYDDAVPILKSFKHLTVSDVIRISELIIDDDVPTEYKTNFNFVPSFIEVTDEKRDIKIQIYKDFDIVHCDNLLKNASTAYAFLKRRGFDIARLADSGLAIIDPTPYGIDKQHTL